MMNVLQKRFAMLVATIRMAFNTDFPRMSQRGQGVGRNVIAGLTVMIVMLLISTLLVTEFYDATEVSENVGSGSGENLKLTVGDKIPTVFKLLAVLLIVVIAGVMLRSLGVF